MLDSDLAALYRVPTRVLNQAVKRNKERFPADFMFRLTKEETENLKSQFVTSSEHGGRRTLPYAFTEQGVAMLSSVLKSQVAVSVNIQNYARFRARACVGFGKEQTVGRRHAQASLADAHPGHKKAVCPNAGANKRNC